MPESCSKRAKNCSCQQRIPIYHSKASLNCLFCLKWRTCFLSSFIFIFIFNEILYRALISNIDVKCYVFEENPHFWGPIKKGLLLRHCAYIEKICCAWAKDYILDSMPAASDMTDWNVIFRTGHGQGAGTDSNIFLQITDKMFIKSPIVKFDGALKGTFERKSKDKFSFKLPSQYKDRFIDMMPLGQTTSGQTEQIYGL